MSKYIVGQNSIMDSRNSASPRMFTEGQEIPEDIIETYKKSDVLDILLKDGRIKEVKEDKEENQEENKEQSQETGKEESQQENTEQNQEAGKEESQQENTEQNQEVDKEESQQAEQKSAKQTKTKK
ncbi:hypothetical protein [Brachyspira alvinipulli]|uniref:hypothetical protein n=1 Tax=Brachyspira alvinipulli TaxID=84379 RepID=UPI000480BE86|nr:hypothetical protein [Brachyspira alvinipulli]